LFDAMTSTSLSTEQLAIARYIAEETGNVLVRARAGTGKSFTLRKIVPLLSGTVAIVCFGKDPAAEMKAKCAEEGIKADVGTFHGFGLRALRGPYKNAKIISAREKFDLIAEQLNIPQHLHSFAQKAMGLAMQRGFGIFFPLNDKQQWLDLVDHFDLDNELGEDNISLKLVGREKTIQDGLSFACKAVKLGLKMVHEFISFDDMMYAPLVLNLKFPTFANVLVDEAQDSNDCRREMARRMALRRLVFVGDDMQAIMGFTGADNDALDIIKAQFDCTEFPLTVTFRCCQQVVALAQTLCPDYKAHPSNPLGSLDTIDAEAFGKLALVPGEDAVICRKTAPLVTVCYSLISRGIPAKVIGKNIGDELLTLVNRWKIKSLVALKDRLEAYRDKKITKLLEAKKETAAEALSDKVETLMVLIAALPPTATVADLRTQIETLFSKKPDGTEAPVVTLMTAHKSKGLEFKRVFGYGNNAWFPSRYATQPWQLAQEDHLLYVLWTRAMQAYVDVVVEV
jgi:DNA helicase II / ATP-dependent DNA helicase PcrA